MPKLGRIGRYHAANSPIHRLDPRIKLVMALIYMVSCLFVNSAATLALAGVAVCLAARASRIPISSLFAQLKTFALLLALTSVINLFFVHSGTLIVAAGPVALYTGGIAAAALYTLRFLFLLAAGSLLALTTTALTLADAAGRLLAPLERIGVPVGQAMLILSIALRFAPTLSREANNILAAQTARGAGLEQMRGLAYLRACIPLAVPLFASALRHADNLARAMDARCHTGGERTHYHVMRLSLRRDAPAVLALGVYLVALVLLRAAGL